MNTEIIKAAAGIIIPLIAILLGYTLKRQKASLNRLEEEEIEEERKIDGSYRKKTKRKYRKK
ncbi:hypothetical protein [uncultured Pedobacter sp.]|uniref:hypothetical protein n=1 Tax=uncultured Pedobacter sp. TaxID=246139 RepID=UPI0025D9BD25|nr:hypothetical protein [uncultured Pedobacter sp.]